MSHCARCRADAVGYVGENVTAEQVATLRHFANASLDCVVLSDRYGVSRDRCTRQRSDVESERAALVAMLKAAADNGFGNVRYVDPIDLFCDARVCQPFSGNRVFYHDGGHLSTQGADLVFDAFEKDFRWVAWRE